MGSREAATSTVLVLDSCIWIDLAKGGVLEEVFKLPYKIIDPDVLIQEEVKPTTWEKLVNLGLTFIPASPDEVAEVAIINNVYRGISFYDASVLELAKRMNSLLLTDDSKLKKVAKENSVQVEGIIWVMNEMVSNKCISGLQAITALERIDHSGHTIPNDVLERYKRRWAKS